MKKSQQPLSQLVSLRGIDVGIELFILVIGNHIPACRQDGCMLFLLPRHLPPKIPQFGLSKKEMRKTIINLRDQPFDVGKTQQWIERRCGIHASLRFLLRNSSSSICFSESRIIECTSNLNKPR